MQGGRGHPGERVGMPDHKHQAATVPPWGWGGWGRAPRLSSKSGELLSLKSSAGCDWVVGRGRYGDVYMA
eukprot:4536464-Prymnesium_polylepis.2